MQHDDFKERNGWSSCQGIVFTLAQSQIVIHRAKSRRLAPCNTVTSTLRSLLSSPVGDRISDVPLYISVQIWITKVYSVTLLALREGGCVKFPKKIALNVTLEWPLTDRRHNI